MPFFNLPQSGTGIPALSGSGAPSSTLGVDGQLYIDTASSTLYGPKKNGEWGSGIAMTGAAWGDVTNKPTTFSPSAHQHAIADVTSLQTSLDGKAATSHNHTASQSTDFHAAVVAASPPTTNASLLTNGTLASARLPLATNAIAGAMIAGSGLSVSNGTVSVSTGSSNLSLSDATPAALGTAAAGSSNLAARADHVHLLPSLSTLGAAAAAHGHNYVTALNNLTGGLTLAAGGNVTISSANSTLTIAASGGGLGANDAVDGGDYVGEILAGITFSLQPQSQTLNGSTTLTVSDVASGTKLRAVSGTIGDVSGLSGTLYAQRISGTKAGLVYSTDNGSTWDWTGITRTNSSAYYRFGQYISASGSLITASPEMFLASNGTTTLVITAITDSVAGFSDSGQPGMSWVYSADAAASLSNAAITNLQFQTLAYLPSAGRWAATGIVGNLYTSSDGTNWTSRDAAISATIQNYGYYGKRVYAIGGRFVTWQGTGIVSQLHSWYSTDGITWVPTPIAFGITTEAASGTRIVGISDESTSTVSVVRVTTDGQSWQKVTLPVQCKLIRYGAGLFWAFPGVSSTDVLTSPDGVTWTVRTDSSGSVKSGGGGVPAAAFFPRADATILGATVGSSALSANLTVAATSGSGAAVAYQWQRSIDAGTTWGNVTNATSTTLSLVNLTQSDSGTRYRAAAFATGAASVTSQSATLTVTG